MPTGNPGLKRKPLSEKTKFKIGEANAVSLKGRKLSEVHKKNISNAVSGEKSFRWIVDRNKLQRYNDENKDRRSSSYREWRKQVWLRDNFKCRINNQDCNGKIQAHHILSWRKYPELRYNLENGITLCKFHHPRKRKDEIRLSGHFKKLLNIKLI